MDKLLQELCLAKGISGNEKNMSALVKKHLSEFADVNIEPDGSILANICNDKSAPHILFDAHIDQIGLIVTGINKEGFLNVAPCGGIDPRVLYGNTVNVHGKSEFIGIVCSKPPHLSSAKDKNFPKSEDILIDVGMTEKEAKENINIGDYISFIAEPKGLLNNNISSPATDNRAGVYVLIKLAEKLFAENLNVNCTILLSSREEIGGMGAKISSYKISPDEAIAVDVSFARQAGLTDEKYSELEKGPMIGISPALSREISNKLIDIAKIQNILYQLEVIGGKTSTNADNISISKEGVPCGLVSIPQRYMHTNVEIINETDLENTIELLFNYVKYRGEK